MKGTIATPLNLNFLLPVQRKADVQYTITGWWIWSTHKHQWNIACTGNLQCKHARLNSHDQIQTERERKWAVFFFSFLKESSNYMIISSLWPAFHLLRTGQKYKPKLLWVIHYNYSCVCAILPSKAPPLWSTSHPRWPLCSLETQTLLCFQSQRSDRHGFRV